MHGFFLMHAVIHLLACLTVAFFILFAASKADGLVKLFGNILGIIFILIGIAGVVFGVMHHGDHDGMMGERMHGWGPPWMMHGGQEPAQPNAAPAPATPATPAPATPAPAPSGGKKS
jgi:hypothetical protein